jgi:hypothetical protein
MHVVVRVIIMRMMVVVIVMIAGRMEGLWSYPS